MHKRKKIRNLVIFMAFGFILMAAGSRLYMPFGDQPMQPFSMEASSFQKDDPLYEEIEKKSRELEEEPENAYIDKIWKKTPGRNGLKVDVKKSYQKMKKAGKYDETLLVTKEIAPEKKLGDLPPAPIYRGHPDKQMVAFLINVSWGTEYIPNMLKVLKDQNVKATFFIEGQWAKKHADYVKMIHEEGHQIGNHAYSHPDMQRLTRKEMNRQIAKTNAILEAIIDEKPVWFAPPSGSFNDQVVEVAAEEGMQTVLWTVDTIDWKNPTVSVMVNRVSGKLHPGATVLMHPTKPVSDGMEALIKEVKKRGYKLNTVERLMSEERN